MAYAYTNSKGKIYFLHARETMLKNKRAQIIYFFAREEKEGVLDVFPQGYVIVESRNGLPILKKADSNLSS